MSGGEELFSIGRIPATHGIRGHLKAHLFSGSAATLAGAGSVVLRNSRGEMTEYRVAGVTGGGKKTILVLDGFDNVNQVLSLVGSEILIRREQFPDLEEDEYFWCDLIGLLVVTDAGETLGRLEDIIVTGSNDVYVVRSAEREYLIPAIDDVVTAVDLDRRTMTVHLLEGLLDL